MNTICIVQLDHNERMHKMKKKTIITLVGWIISIALIFSLFAHMNLDTMWKNLIKAKWAWLIIAALINLLVVGIKAYRWQLIMDPQRKNGQTRRSSYWLVLKATLLGLAGNNLLPVRGGDWLKIYILGNWVGKSKASLASMTGLEKMFEGITILVLFGFFSLIALFPGQNHHTFPIWVKTGSMIVSLAVAASLLICISLLYYHKININNHKSGKISKFIRKLGSGMDVLSRKKVLTGTILISLTTSLLQILTLWACQKAFDIHFTLWVPTIVFIAINLAIVIPSAPSNIGPFETAAVLTYTWIGLKTETAFNIALMYHAVQFLPVTIFGMILYWKNGFAHSSASKVRRNYC